MVNPYYNPEAAGLQIVGDIEWRDEPYEFDMTVVWRDPATGDLFYADDSGCSCPSPFEEYDCTPTNREGLTRATKAGVIQHLASHNLPQKSMELAERVRALPLVRP